MKKFAALVLFSLILFSSQIHAQAQMEFFGLRSWAIPRPYFTDKGWGGGMNYLCRPLAINGKNNPHPIDFQFGEDFYVCGLGYHTLRDIPLAEPSTGNSKVKFSNALLGGNLFIRFSRPNATTGYIPYIDIIGGGRRITSQMTVSPDHVLSGYERNTNTPLNHVGGWSYGAGIGLQKKISDNASLDCELIWSYSPTSNKIVDLASVQRSGDEVIYDVRNSPNSVILLKVGFNFRVQNNPGGWRSGWHHDYDDSNNRTSTTTTPKRPNTVHVGTGRPTGGTHPSVPK